MSESKVQIRLHNVEEVEEFVQAASRCEFDINIYYNRVIIDAKSLLGVMSMDLNRPLTVQYYGRNPEFEQILYRYAVQPVSA